MIPGNHEFPLEDDPRLREQFTNATLLIDQAAQVAGLNVWGSPLTPLYGGAFGRVSDAARARVWASIPLYTDILITHGPPYGILDQEGDSRDHAGCAEFLEAVIRVKPRLHVFGHIHGGCGVVRTERTIFVNAALPGLGNDVAGSPIVIELGDLPKRATATKRGLTARVARHSAVVSVAGEGYQIDTESPG